MLSLGDHRYFLWLNQQHHFGSLIFIFALFLALSPYHTLVWRRRREERKKCPLSSLSLPFYGYCGRGNNGSPVKLDSLRGPRHRFLMPDARGTAAGERGKRIGGQAGRCKNPGGNYFSIFRERSFTNGLGPFRHFGCVRAASDAAMVSSKNWERSQGAAATGRDLARFPVSQFRKLSLVVGPDQIRAW